MSEQLKKVRHDYIRYANCWEDADILLDALQVGNDDRVLSIGSAGDNSFSMLAQDAELVVAVDINPVQLNLIELKKAAIATLNHQEFLQFLGFEECEQRWELFQTVKSELSSEIASFWSNRRQEIEEGIIYQGKFEKYFKLFHKKVLPLIHTKKRIRRLFELKSANEQAEYFNASWNNRRWRLLFKIFFSRFVMGRLGRDPQFLKEVEVPVSTFIASTANDHLSSVACQQNYFLQFILTGKFNTALPHYARKENFELIKPRIHRMTVYNGLAEDAFKAFEGFNKFNLSNIFEYMNPELFQSVSENLWQEALSGARYAYWNLMVPRRMSKILSGLFYDEANAQHLSQQDKGFFYGN
ncbi:DUF3419 family protein, partial [Microscilla marina]